MGRNETQVHLLRRRQKLLRILEREQKKTSKYLLESKSTSALGAKVPPLKEPQETLKHAQEHQHPKLNGKKTKAPPLKAQTRPSTACQDHTELELEKQLLEDFEREEIRQRKQKQIDHSQALLQQIEQNRYLKNGSKVDDRMLAEQVHWELLQAEMYDKEQQDIKRKTHQNLISIRSSEATANYMQQKMTQLFDQFAEKLAVMEPLEALQKYESQHQKVLEDCFNYGDQSAQTSADLRKIKKRLSASMKRLHHEIKSRIEADHHEQRLTQLKRQQAFAVMQEQKHQMTLKQQAKATKKLEEEKFAEISRLEKIEQDSKTMAARNKRLVDDFVHKNALLRDIEKRREEQRRRQKLPTKPRVSSKPVRTPWWIDESQSERQVHYLTPQSISSSYAEPVVEFRRKQTKWHD